MVIFNLPISLIFLVAFYFCSVLLIHLLHFIITLFIYFINIFCFLWLDSQNYLITFTDACQENVWRTHLDMDDCTETIRMRCVGLFPKPSASCGVFNEDTKTFLTSVPFDRVVTLRNHTYEVTLTNQYFMRDWTSYINISFKCYFVIDNTSWRRGITYKLFGGKTLTFFFFYYVADIQDA